MDKTLLAQPQNTLYSNLDNRAESILELIHALSSNQHARSVVELSLSPLFRRGHASLYEAIHAFASQKVELRQMASVVAPKPKRRSFWLMSTDVTAQPRPYARTLEDRSYVHAPTPVPGQKAVTIGHAYTSTMLLPEREKGTPPWVIPLEVQRVGSKEDPELKGAKALRTLLEDEKMPWHGDLVVSVVDSKYSKSTYLSAISSCENLVTVARVRSNRAFYQMSKPTPNDQKKRGPHRHYGDKFALGDPETWHKPDVELTLKGTTAKGKLYTVVVKVWYNMLMRGHRGEAMYNHPFTLIVVETRDASGKLVHKKSLWLVVFGSRRHEVTPEAAVWAYFQRFDHEHFFRFGKQRMLLTAFQTPDVHREEAWWCLSFLAYLFLWAARPVAQQQWRPWEKHLAGKKDPELSPSQVQRDFARIIQEFELQPPKPKPRGKSQGWPAGYRRKRRERLPIIKKSQKRRKKRKKAA